jgi:DNA-binding PadR family transcriptional regulator
MSMRDRDPKDLLPLHPRDFLILFALVDGDQHGYALVKRVEEESDGEVRMDPANLYRSLRRLERDGLVKELPVRTRDADADRRRMYRLTDFGRRVVAAEAVRVRRLARAAEAKRLIPGQERAR